MPVEYQKDYPPDHYDWYCCNCLKPCILDKHGRCEKCGSGQVLPHDRHFHVQYARVEVREAALSFWGQVLFSCAPDKVN